MKKNIMIIILIIILFSSCGETKNFTQSEINNSTEAIAPEQMTKQMGIGIDAAWSEFPKQIKKYSTQATVAFAKKGFQHIRLRVAENNASKMWNYLDKEIQDALDNNMIPIIANQSADFEDNPTPQNQAKWVKWWHIVAIHYKNTSYKLMFDLEVEIAASSPLSHEPINQLNEAYKEAIHTIRHSGGHNDKRIIIISAHRRSDPKKLYMLNVASYEGNGYLIGEFHEGYASGPSKDPSSSHYFEDGSTKIEINLIEDRIKAAANWRAKTKIPVWEGAWMPGNYNKGDDYTIQEQKKFASDFLKILNKYNIPSAINATNKFYDLKTNQWNQREAVINSIQN
ncbi:hypothetical protein [Lutibacter sp.]